MFVQKVFDVADFEVIQAVMQTKPFATLVSLSSEGLEANHMPLLYVESEGTYGQLLGHQSRTNPFITNLAAREALVIFHGANGYISPSWYATKQETGKVVPTWNYSVVHAYGQLEVIDDPVWVRQQIEDLTNKHEANFPEPWKVSDAPPEYSERLINTLVGIQINITRIVAKNKASQNQPERNRMGIIKGLKSFGDSELGAVAGAIPLDR